MIQAVRRYAIDAASIGSSGAGAIACWVFDLPVWMLVACVIWLVFALISLLGDLGLFGRPNFD